MIVDQVLLVFGTRVPQYIVLAAFGQVPWRRYHILGHWSSSYLGVPRKNWRMPGVSSKYSLRHPSSHSRDHKKTTRCGHSHFCSIFAPRNRLTAFIFGEVTSYHKVRPAPDIHPVLGRDYLVHPHARGERGHYGTLPSIQNQSPALAGRGRDHPNPRPLHHIGNSFAGTDRAVLLHPLGRIGHSPHHTPAPAADRGWHPAARTTLLCLLNKSCIPRQMEQPVVAAFTPLCPTTSSPCNGGLQSLQPRIGVLAVEGLESLAARTGLNPADEHGNQPNQSAFN